MKIEDAIKSSFRSEEQKVRVNIYFTSYFLNNQIVEVLKQFKLSFAQYNTLRILRGQYPKSISLLLLRDRMLDKGADVSRLVERLFQRDLIDRRESKEDRRKRDISINQNGLDLLTLIEPLEAGLDQHLSHLTQEENEQLHLILNKIRKGNVS